MQKKLEVTDAARLPEYFPAYGNRIIPHYFTDWSSLLWSASARSLQGPGLFLTTSFADLGFALPRYAQKQDSDTFSGAPISSFRQMFIQFVCFLTFFIFLGETLQIFLGKKNRFKNHYCKSVESVY